jgi:hypothetical protein
MPLYQWSTTPANNASAGAIDWAEGQPPSTVNDSARQMMADVATWFQSPEWLNYGLTPTYVSGTQFTLAGNQTTIYSVGRRVKASVTAGTVYGTITASAYTSLTTVTVTWDIGALDSGLSEVDAHIINPALHQNFALQTLTLTDPANGIQTLNINGANNTNGANIKLTGSGATTPNKYIRVNNGVLVVLNSAASLTQILTLDDSGNLTLAGNVTAYSDERLKKDWKPVSDGFLEKLSAVKSGTFRRTDIGEIQAGVSAQDLQKVLPEAVGGGAILSVAYGQAALVACVELAKEVLRLRSLVEAK